ncbi:MAG: hypothetical protein IT373_04220 [Polyangiaceae bacterium]|nr:hypothetical protein [Polyangiaceae bacterium]
MADGGARELRFRYRCARCGFEIDAGVGGARMALAARMLEGDGLAALAGGATLARAMGEATHLLRLAPCPRCGRRSRRALAAVGGGVAGALVLAGAGVVAGVVVGGLPGWGLAAVGGLGALLVARRALAPLWRAPRSVVFDTPPQSSPS